MSPLPPLPPLGKPKAPTCDVCKGVPTRFVDTSVGRFNLCDTCEPPDVIPATKPRGLPPLLVKRKERRCIRCGHMEGLAVSEGCERNGNGLHSYAPLPVLPPLAPPSAPKAPAKVKHIEATIYVDCPPARILVADPPWQFGDATPHKGAEDHYKCLDIEAIKAFPLPPLADDAILFMWRVGGGSEKDGSLGDQAYDVVRAWGFTPKSELCWQKTTKCKVCDGNGYATDFLCTDAATGAAKKPHKLWCEACSGRGYKVAFGQGRYVRGSHEICLIATRGKPIFPEEAIRSTFNATRLKHSQKPQLFYDLVEQLYPEGPYVELFARRRREGWHCYGDELPPEGEAVGEEE
jgi:N6-adenosine-specific RNA methylase IME4